MRPGRMNHFVKAIFLLLSLSLNGVHLFARGFEEKPATITGIVVASDGQPAPGV